MSGRLQTKNTLVHLSSLLSVSTMTSLPTMTSISAMASIVLLDVIIWVTISMRCIVSVIIFGMFIYSNFHITALHGGRCMRIIKLSTIGLSFVLLRLLVVGVMIICISIISSSSVRFVRPVPCKIEVPSICDYNLEVCIPRFACYLMSHGVQTSC